jgi:hypothetical protein
VPGKPSPKVQVNAQIEKARKAYGIMAEVRTALYQRLADYVLGNERRIKAEMLGEESYSFCLQQMDDLFLNKLNVVERAVAELSRCETREKPQAATTYEVVEVLASRDELPQKVADALAAHGESDLLNVCVLRADEKQAEVLLVLAREETAPPASGVKPKPEEDAGGGGDT